jgi:threonine/homoserine/homoserine lactone efflux protein
VFGIQHFWLFLTAGILLNLTPGPDTAFILGRSIAGGRRVGIASALGITLGSIFHTCAAALGLSAVLVTSALAFGLVKVAGACYLIFLGVRMLFQSSVLSDKGADARRVSARAAFVQGMLTNVLNPKVALFFLAFLPQFIDSAAATKIPAFLVLGFTFVTTGTIWCLILAWSAGTISRRLRANQTAAAWLNRTLGGLFVALGLRLATSR